MVVLSFRPNKKKKSKPFKTVSKHSPKNIKRISRSRTALDAVIDKDLQAAVGSSELLKGFYKSKTDKKA